MDPLKQTTIHTSSLKEIPVMESFYTIQGEGYNSGIPAYFIRTAGCDIGCHWCDVKESWTVTGHPVKTVAELVKEVKEHGAKTVVITGGEPLMYDLTELTTALDTEGIHICLETSGAYPLTGKWHWICLSPKKFKAPLPEIYENAQELKMIIFNRSDLQWAEEHAALVAPDCKLYLQPEWSKREKMLPLIIEYAKKHPRWNISLQTHKYMGIP